MDPRLIARGVALVRILLGAGIVAKPELFTVPWIGREANRPGARVLSRGLGIRDLVLGAGAISCDDSDLQSWLLATITADTVDLAATLAAGGDIPLAGRVIVSGAAFSGAALSLAALVGLNR